MKKNAALLMLAIVVVALWWRLGGGEGESSPPPVEDRTTPASAPGWLEPSEPGGAPTPRAEPREALDPSIAEPQDAPATEETAGAPTTLAVRGRVLADESGLPLAGARVQLFSTYSDLADGGLQAVASLPVDVAATTGPDGRFELPLPSGGRDSLIASADGRATVRITFDGPSDSPESEVEVRIPRSARLTGVVIDSREVEEELVVCVKTGTSWMKLSPGRVGFPGPLSYTGSVGPDGHFTVEDLPPGQALQATVVSKGGEVVLHEPTTLTLRAGEERVVWWRITGGGGTTLFGRVLDQDGFPLAGVTIWLLPSSEASWMWMLESWTPTEQRVSDALGAFSFTDLPPGEWTVGAAPDEETVAPCTRVALTPGALGVEVEVRRHAGSFIDGRVLTPSGEGAAGARLLALGLEGGASKNTRTDEVGSFRVGPLLPGEYRLQASRLGRGVHAPSEKVVVTAGSTGVVLRLQLGGRVSGEVVDAASGGRVATAGISIHSEGGSDYRMVVERPGGSFDFGGLEPGSYHLIGTTKDGRTGSLREVVVEPGIELAELRIPVQHGGYVRLRYEGSPECAYANFTIEQEGVKYVHDLLHAGTERRVAVPHGELSVRLWGNVPVGPPPSTDRRAFDRERKIEIDVGGELEVLFELDD